MPFRPKGNAATPTAGDSAPPFDNHYALAFRSHDSLQTLESDTAPDLWGHGRTLGMMTSFAGMKLEGWVSKWAVKNGKTPRAVSTQLREIGQKLKRRGRPYGNYSQLSRDDVQLMKKLCKQILQWVRQNNSPAIQFQAIQAIVDLVTEFPALSAAFTKENAAKHLAAVSPDRQRCENEMRAFLHAATRQALVCVDEVTVLRLVCKMGVHAVREREWREITKQLVGYARDPNVSFLVLRCFREWWSWADTETQALLDGAGELARVDENAVDREALAGALWWLDYRRLMVEGDVFVNGDIVDREQVWHLGKWAKQRAALCDAYELTVPEELEPIGVAALLHSRASRIPSARRSLLADLASYPFYLYDQLAKRFPQVHRRNLARTIAQLVACHASTDAALRDDAALVLRFLARLHSWLRSAIASHNPDILLPVTAGPSPPTCQRFVRTTIHRHSFGINGCAPWAYYCVDPRCWDSHEYGDDGLSYLCLRTDAPALSYVIFKPGSHLQAASLAPIVAHHEGPDAPAYLAYYNTPRYQYLSTAGNQDLVFSSVADGDTAPEAITNLHLLCFDLPADGTEAYRDLYDWADADEIPDLDIIVLRYRLDDNTLRYECNPCNNCRPRSHWRPSWFSWNGDDTDYNRFQFHGFFDVPPEEP